MKRILAMLLVVLLIAGLMPAVYAESTAVQKVASGRMRNGFRWTFNPNDGILTIYGNGEMPVITEPVPWEVYRDQIIMIIISDGVKSLSDGCFAGIPNLESVLISPTVAVAGSDLFDGCKKLSFIGYEGDLAILRNLLSKNDIANIEMGNYTVTQDENGHIVYRLPSGNTVVLEDGTIVGIKDKRNYAVGDVDVTVTVLDNDEIVFEFDTIIPDPLDASGYIRIFGDNQQHNHIKIRYNKKGEIKYYSEKPDNSGLMEPTITSGYVEYEKKSGKTILTKICFTTSEGTTLDLDLKNQKPDRQTMEQEVYGIPFVEKQEYDNGILSYVSAEYPSINLQIVAKKTGENTSEIETTYSDGRVKTVYQNDKNSVVEGVIVQYADDQPDYYKTLTEDYKDGLLVKQTMEYRAGQSSNIKKMVVYYKDNTAVGQLTVYNDGKTSTEGEVDSNEVTSGRGSAQLQN